MKTVIVPATTRDIGDSLSTQTADQKRERRQCFLKILSNVKFLARQGLPLRGDGDETDSNFVQLLKLRAEDDSRVHDWLKKKTDKYTSADMQNELLKVMALQVLRGVTSDLHGSLFYSVMVDESTDISNKEQVVMCLRCVTDDFDPHEHFIGM